MKELVTVKNDKIIISKNCLNQLKKLNKLKMEMDILEQKVREGLQSAMKERGIKKFGNEILNATFIEATTRKSLDTKKIKEEFPEIYRNCLKEVQVKESVRLSYND